MDTKEELAKAIIAYGDACTTRNPLLKEWASQAVAETLDRAVPEPTPTPKPKIEDYE